MVRLNFRALFSQNVSGPIQVQNQNKQAANLAHMTLLPKNNTILPLKLVFHIIFWREIQTQHASYQLYSFLTLVVL